MKLYRLGFGCRVFLKLDVTGVVSIPMLDGQGAAAKALK